MQSFAETLNSSAILNPKNLGVKLQLLISDERNLYFFIINIILE